MGFLAICVRLSLLLALSKAYPSYRDQIPNGHNVPHPCKVNFLWDGVGHQNPGGGGVRNDFGLAFAAAGHQWTQDLCRADSDGDGVTNGQELGDPNCTWAQNSDPSRIVNISHPGICDPYNSDFCKSKNTFLICDPDVFQTGTTPIVVTRDPDVFQPCTTSNDTNVKSINLTFPETRVPASDTNSMCFSFDLPDDQDYHIFGNAPIITNQNVVHHMLLTGCAVADDPKELAPVPCGMSTASNCKSIIGMWRVGLNGSCYGDHLGFRIGKTGFSKVRLQIYYNNTDLIQNYTDSSGLQLFYRPVQDGDQDLGVLMVGQLLLTLPPGKSQVQVDAVCPSNCTKTFVTKPANITRTMNYMHYLGKSMTVSVYRNGTKQKDLSYDAAYSYDSPVDHIQDPEFELVPGDEITTTCVYNTISSKRYVYFGEATSDEMCHGFITFYPDDAIVYDECMSFGNYSACELRSEAPMGGCNWAEFLNFSNPASAKIVNDVRKNCNLNGFCRPECRDVLNSLQDNPCLKGTANEWITSSLSLTQEGVNFLGRLRSCPISESCTGQCPSCNTKGGDGAAGRLVVNAAIVLLMSVLIMFI